MNDETRTETIPALAKRRKFDFWDLLQKVFPFVGLLVIMIIFTVAVKDGKMWSVYSIKTVFSIAIPYCIGGAGMVFVASQGSTDMSQGSLLALSGTIGAMVAATAGNWAMVPVSMGVGCLIGIFNGTMLARFKVPSVMVTLAMLIILRAFVTLITNGKDIRIAPALAGTLDSTSVKVGILIAVILVMGYLFEFTKCGFFSRCIGENQTVGQFSGISVKTYKIIAFAFSGLMAGLCGALNVAKAGGASPQLGNFFELEVMTAIFVGGIPVEGGATSKFYKVVVGAFMIAFLKQGLSLSGVNSSTQELIQGLLLLCVVFFGLFVKGQFLRRQRLIAATES
ncbi:ribose ABC transporter permease [Clostridia bacterium]|nr:ribose ABC transporter permease [Clostridia bacterium]